MLTHKVSLSERSSSSSFFGGASWFLNRQPSAFDAKAVNVSHAQDNGRSLAGNQYSVTGTLVDRKIKDEGQIVALSVEENGVSKILPVMLGKDFQSGNLSLQEKYSFLIQFNNEGVAVALEVKQM
ncbi:hypothetical protein N9921_01665 [Akkermansiaceae bacterium]|nr:hypothetical protein [Akkermansiaceae bacterium]